MFVSDDMRDLLRLFHEHGVSFAVCGGFAVAHYGFVRMTLDLDLLIDPAPENARRVFDALVEFGFGDAGITVDSIQRADAAFTLGAPPNQIDLLTKMSSVPASEVLGRSVDAEIDGVPVPVVAREDLVFAKREAGTPKGRLDLEELENLE